MMVALLAENGMLYSRLVRTFAGRDAAGSQRGAAAEVVKTISNELHQPLCAITANADAIRQLLEHPRQDLAEVRAALDDIVGDAKRASETLRSAQRMLAGANQAPAVTEADQRALPAVPTRRGRTVVSKPGWAAARVAMRKCPNSMSRRSYGPCSPWCDIRRMSLLTTVDRRGPEAAVAHTLPVTPDNFVRAETDMQFMTVVKRGGFGRLVHDREFPPAGRQPLAWADADVLRSRGVFDLELGPVVVTLPPSGDRFVSIEALDEDHYSLAMFYGPGTYTFSFDNVSTRYMLIVVRILLDPASRTDLAAVHALQDGTSWRVTAADDS